MRAQRKKKNCDKPAISDRGRVLSARLSIGMVLDEGGWGPRCSLPMDPVGDHALFCPKLWLNALHDDVWHFAFLKVAPETVKMGQTWGRSNCERSESFFFLDNVQKQSKTTYGSTRQTDFMGGSLKVTLWVIAWFKPSKWFKRMKWLKWFKWFRWFRRFTWP